MGLLTDKLSAGFGKNTVYRFMQSAQINWIRFTSFFMVEFSRLKANSQKIKGEKMETLIDIS